MYQQGQPPPPGQYPPPPGYQQGQPPPPGYQQGQPPPPGQYPSQPGMQLQQHPSQYSQGRPPPPPPQQQPIQTKGFSPWCCGAIEAGAKMVALIDVIICAVAVCIFALAAILVWVIAAAFCGAFVAGGDAVDKAAGNGRDSDDKMTAGEALSVGCLAFQIALTIVCAIFIVVFLIQLCFACYLKSGVAQRNLGKLRCWLIVTIIFMVINAGGAFHSFTGDALVFGVIGLLIWLFHIYQVIVIFFYYKALKDMPPGGVVTRPPTVMTVNQGYPAQQMSVQQQQGYPPPQQQQGYPPQQQQPMQEQQAV